MSNAYNAIFLQNEDGSVTKYARTGSDAPPPEPEESDFTVTDEVNLTTKTPSQTLTLTRVTGTGEFSAVSSDTDVVECSVSEDTLTLTGLVSGTALVTVTMAAAPGFTSCTKTIYVSVSIVKIVSWSNGTDEEIAAMVAAADAGEIDLYEDGGWRVGDERSVTLSAIAASGTYDGVTWSVENDQPAQTVEFVLMHRGGKTLTSAVKNVDGTDRTNCSFIVGVKDSLNRLQKQSSNNYNTYGWETTSNLRKLCNGGFRQAIPATLRSVFKQHYNVTSRGSAQAAATTSIDYFALPAEKEVFGSNTYANSSDESSLIQFSWYETAANRKKRTNTYEVYWTRSPGTNAYWALVSASGGNDATMNSGVKFGVSPFGCI